MRREERVTVQGPVKKQQPNGMSHRGASRIVCVFGGGVEGGRLQLCSVSNEVRFLTGGLFQIFLLRKCWLRWVFPDFFR